MQFKRVFVSLFSVFVMICLFSPNTMAHCLKKGEWITNVAVICENGWLQKTREVVELMCRNRFVTTGYEPHSGDFKEALPESNKQNLEAVIQDVSSSAGGTLHVKFHIFELKDLDSHAKSVIKTCVEAIIFYDLDDPRLDNLDENTPGTINEGINFLLSFDWNNCINFANYCTDYEKDLEILRGSRSNPHSNRNQKVNSYAGQAEHDRAYKRPIYKGHNNRWGRTYCGVSKNLLNSILQRFIHGSMIDSIGYVKYIKYDENSKNAAGSYTEVCALL